ncbi:MAG: hypothetical protein AAB618_03590 [Patescibacteria group bacterium]
MTRLLQFKTVLLGASLLIIFAYVAGVFIAKENLADLEDELLSQINEQRTHLNTIAEITARNGADEVTERIVKDCDVDERAKFDALLGELDSGLARSDLVILERLFGRCGSFYAARKAVMVARLEREVEVYENYVQQLGTINPSNIDEYQVGLYKELAAEEKFRSETFSSLVIHQNKIVTLLLEGKDVTSPEVKSILEQVKLTQQILTNTSAAVSEKRQALISS